MTVITGRTVKRYREGNITAAFGADLLLHGSTAIPNLLLRFYRQMELTDEEMMLIIQLLRLRNEERNLLPSVTTLSQCTSQEARQVEQNLSRLLEKELLDITQYYDETADQVINGYDFEPLFEKLSEIWACQRVKEIERTRSLLEKRAPDITRNDFDFALVVKAFEQEFGRPISPIEAEQIRHWTGQVDTTLVLEALRRAVLMGKHNFKYIDSILLEWKKNNLRTLEEVSAYDEQFKKRRKGKHSGANGEPETDQRRKALLKTLYLS
ncbi:DnaD domain protein [Desulfofundulus thermobenzoicus]|uniref:DnaD domain protein n=1 Tax=Desulfofundulus thermobenzoicus TaxID=29376 RepID=A0A6N7IUE4_9FIRM|nr:DnaD domain protein [Desulfofundulus thermobenzoicus]MQL53067.1 DnaD domain protein [Desulfofundulus thermobenzoicus]HHW43325.1 DnaD domain protein [Desulfotomaculum sp.]